MAPESTISRIGQLSLTVPDIKRATAFYRDLVGLPLLFEVPNLAFFDCGGVRIMLTLPENDQPIANSVFYFVVSDIEANYTAMVDRGIEFVKEPHLLTKMPDHELWMAFFRDSEQNLMALMCEKR